MSNSADGIVKSVLEHVGYRGVWSFVAGSAVAFIVEAADLLPKIFPAASWSKFELMYRFLGIAAVSMVAIRLLWWIVERLAGFAHRTWSLHSEDRRWKALVKELSEEERLALRVVVERFDPKYMLLEERLNRRDTTAEEVLVREGFRQLFTRGLASHKDLDYFSPSHFRTHGDLFAWVCRNPQSVNADAPPRSLR